MTICIYGNGLTALTLAKVLVNQNIYVDVIYSKKHSNSIQTRTIGVSKNNFEFLEKNIFNIKKLSWELKKIEIFSDNLKKERLISFENNSDQLFSTIKNHELYELLQNQLSQNKYFKSKFIRNSSLSFINKYDLVINCDSNNIITKKYFFKKIIKEYDSYAYTSIIKHKNILNDTAVQVFTKEGPLAFLPISNRETSIVYSVYNSFNKKKNIEQLVRDKNLKYKILNIKKINAFKLKSLNLRSYYHNNILAFGDLLHRIHPLAGQGFNMTIRDIRKLTQIILNRYDLGLQLNNSVNKEFEKSMKHKNLIFSNGIDLIYEIFNLERKTKTKLLSRSVQLINKNDFIKKAFIKIADQGVNF